MHWTSREKWRVLASLGVMGLALALYANSLAGDFVFDDHSAIRINPDVRSSTPLSSVFGNDFWGLPLSDAESHKSYRPLTVLSFRLNHHLHGLWAPGFHAVNIAAHAFACVLFFWACLDLGAPSAPSLTASLLFASHPIHTEAVANIVGRSELLAAIFFLLALLSYQRATRKDTALAPAWILLTVVLSAVSLLCKEQGVTVLGLCLVLELKSLLTSGNSLILPKNTQKNRRSCAYLLRLFILLSTIVALLFVRIHLIGGGTPTFVDSDNPASFSPHLQTRLLTYCYLWSVNGWLLLCPSQLCHDWSMGTIPLVESISDPRNAASLSLLLASLAGGLLLARKVINDKRAEDCCRTELPQSCVVNNHGNKNLNNNNNTLTLQKLTHITTHSKKRPSNVFQLKQSRRLSQSSVLLLVALSWIVIPFLPASNLFFPVGFVVAERVLYLPSMGFCLLVALGINSFRTKTRKKQTAIAVSLLVLIFSAKTVSRNWEWGSTSGIATAALRINPGNAKIHMSMGNELAQQGDRRCEVFYRNAVRLRPQYTSAWTNLGLVLVNTDRHEEAEEAYRTALTIKPDHINANTNMGHLCRLQGRWEESHRYFTTALTRRPTTPTLHYYVGVVSEEIGTERDLEVAVEEYGLAVQYNQQYWEAHHRLGRLLASDTAGRAGETKTTKKERLKKALYHYQAAARLKPDDKTIKNELDSLLRVLNKTGTEKQLRG